MRASRGWVVVAALLVAAGGLLRWWHLATYSLWWDELVEIRMADLPSAWDVLTRVRLGVPPGSGNAGAVPLDYLLLWAWLRLVPMPAPEALETYFRLPSFLWSCLLPPLAGWWTWRTFGAAAGLATTALLAGSVPLALYAAEARFYSLFCLVVLANLATFAALVRAPDRRGAWIGYTVVAVALFLSGLFGLLVVPWQLATLALVRRGRRGERGWRAARPVLWVALALAGAVAIYFADTNLASRSVRGAKVIPWLPNVWNALAFFGMGAPVLPWALAAAPPLAVVVAWRRHRRLLPVVACTALVTIASVPAILTIAESKEHFFHPRHALFLLPLLLVLLGIALGGIAETLAPARLGAARRSVATAAALVVALALVAPAARRYVEQPWRYFTFTKSLHDFRGMAKRLRQRTRAYAPDDRYLLIATRGRGGYLGNPVLAWYLEWYGIGDRVVLRGTSRPATTMKRTRELCWRRCRNLGAVVERDLRLQSAFQLTRAKRQLLGAPVSRPGWPGRPRHIGFAVYPPLARFQLGSPDGYRVFPSHGLHLYELDRPPRP